MFGFVPRSLAVVGIVGALSFGMPVAAQADTSVKVLQFLVKAATWGGLAGVGVKAAAPEVAAGAGFACAAALPVCVGVAAAVVGAALYMTKDTWVPWFTNGATVGASVMGSGTWGTVEIEPMNGQSETVNIVYRIPAGGGGFSTSGNMACRNTDTGAIYNVDTGYGFLSPADPLVRPVDLCNSPAREAGFHNLGWVNWETLSLSNGQNPYMGFATWGPVAPEVASLQVSCRNPDGSQYEVTSSVPSADGLVQAPTCTGAAGDAGGAVGRCVTLSAGQSLSAMSVQASNCVVVAEAELKYPDCAVSGCAYMVLVDGLPCTVGRLGCTDWARTYVNSPGRVGCRYGEYAVKVTSCFFLERVYESSGQPVDGTLANTDGNPDTSNGTEPAPAPNPQPSGQPIPDGAPGGAPGTLPGGGTGPLPSPTGAPLTNADCWGSGTFSWNPVDWVVTPVKCALAWAFVPDAAVMAGPLADFQTVWKSKPPGSLVVGATSVFSSIGSGWDGGCGGAASMSFSQPALGHPLQLPCEPTGGGGGSVPYTAMQIALIVATLIYVWHMVAAGISAQATGSGSD